MTAKHHISLIGEQDFWEKETLEFSWFWWQNIHFHLIIAGFLNGRLKKRSKWGEKNGLWRKFLFWSICRIATAGEMFTYPLDKTEDLSLPVCYKTLNIWAGVTMTGNSSWLRPFQPPWVMKAIKTIQLWKFPWGFHLWHPQSFWALQTQMKQRILFIRTRRMAPIHTNTSKVFSQTPFSTLCSPRTSVLIFLISSCCPWQPLIDYINYTASSYCEEP